MRKYLVVLVVLLAGCVSERTLEDGKEYKCIGMATDEADKNPKVVYEMSTHNLVVAFLFSETVVVPIVVAAEQYKCPERLR